MDAVRDLTTDGTPIRAGSNVECSGVDAAVFRAFRKRTWNALRELNGEQVRQFLFDGRGDGVTISRREPLQHEFVYVQLDRRRIDDR